MREQKKSKSQWVAATQKARRPAGQRWQHPPRVGGPFFGPAFAPATCNNHFPEPPSELRTSSPCFLLSRSTPLNSKAHTIREFFFFYDFKEELLPTKKEVEIEFHARPNSAMNYGLSQDLYMAPHIKEKLMTRSLCFEKRRPESRATDYMRLMTITREILDGAWHSITPVPYFYSIQQRITFYFSPFFYFMVLRSRRRKIGQVQFSYGTTASTIFTTTTTNFLYWPFSNLTVSASSLPFIKREMALTDGALDRSHNPSLINLKHHNDVI